MSTLPHVAKTYTASGAIIGGRAVKIGLGSDGFARVTQAALATDPLHGIAEHSAADGESVSVVRHGMAKATAGGVLTLGAHLRLTADAAGKLVTAAAGNSVVAIFDHSQSAKAGDEIDVFVMTPGKES